MIRNIRFPLALVTASVALAVVMACAEMGSYGKLNPVYSRTDGISLQTLMERWQDFDVYYAGLSTENPSAVMFDPKGDNKQIVSDKWMLLEDNERISEAVHWLTNNVKFPPVLYKMVGPDDRLYGYMYTAWNHVYMKMVDENTLWVHDLPLPPIDYGPSQAK
jgi:hypothetical protein